MSLGALCVRPLWPLSLICVFLCVIKSEDFAPNPFVKKNFLYHLVIISVYREWGVLCFHPLTDRLTSKLSPNFPSPPLQWTWLCLLTLSLFVCFSFKRYLRNNISFRTMYCSFMQLPCFFLAINFRILYFLLLKTWNIVKLLSPQNPILTTWTMHSHLILPCLSHIPPDLIFDNSEIAFCCFSFFYLQD